MSTTPWPVEVMDQLPADRDSELAVLRKIVTASRQEQERLIGEVPPEVFYFKGTKAAAKAAKKLIETGHPLTPESLHVALVGNGMSKDDANKLIHIEMISANVLDLRDAIGSTSARVRETAHQRNRVSAVYKLQQAVGGKGDFTSALEELTGLEERNPLAPVPWLDRPRKSKAIRSDEFVKMDIPEPEILVFPALVMREGVTLWSGPSKVGKSILVLNLSHSLITGEPFLQVHPVKKASVLYLQTEMGAAAVKSRIKNLALISERFWIRNVEPGELKLNTSRKGDFGRRQDTGHRDHIVALVQELREKAIDVLIVDPIYELLDGSEVDEFAMKSLFASLKAIARYTPCAVVAVHHTKKRRENDWQGPELASGHNVLTRAPDALLTIIEKPRGDDTYQYQLKYTLRHAAEPGPVELVRDGGHESLRWRALPWVGGGESNHEVLDVLLDAKGAMSATAIVKETGRSKATIYRELKRLEKAGRAKKVGGFYVIEGTAQ